MKLVRFQPAVWAFLIILVPLSASGQDVNPHGFTVVGRYSRGPARCLALTGDLVMLGSGSRVETIDVSVPSSPAVLGSVDLPSSATRIVEQDGFIYAATAGGELVVIDRHDPRNLRVTATLRTGAEFPPYISGVAISGPYLYWSSGDLRVVDIRDPTRPVVVGVGYHPGGWPGMDVVVANGMAYVAEYEGGVARYDLADPQHPVRLDSAASAEVVSLRACAGAIYFGTHSSFGVLDLSRTWPDVLIHHTGGYAPMAFAVIDSMLYCGDRVGLLQFSLPLTLTWGRPVGQDATAEDLVVSGKLLFSAQGDMGLLIWDLTDSTAPALIGRYATGTRVKGMAQDNDRLYLACGFGGLQVLDLAQPQQPQLLGSISTMKSDSTASMYATEVVVHGGAAVLLGRTGVQVIDVNDPATPSRLLRTDSHEGGTLGSTHRGLALADGVGFVSPAFGALAVRSAPGLDWALAAFPWPTVQTFRTLVQNGSRLTGSDANEVLHLFDLAADGSLLPRGSLALPTPVEYIATTTDRVYTTSENIGLCIVDVDDPNEPTLQGQLNDPWAFHMSVGLAAAGSYVYLPNRYCQGLHLIDAHDPGKPTMVGFQPVPDLPTGIVLHDGLIYVSTEWGGVLILRNDLSEPVATIPENVRATMRAVPNPFNPSTRIAFSLPTSGPATVAVFDLRGRRVKRLYEGWLTDGPHQFTWSGEDEAGRAAAAGTYVVRSTSAQGAQTVKVVLAK